jgi:NADP-dependent 3-hydroxy acid dehydrogenase YdfG
MLEERRVKDECSLKDRTAVITGATGAIGSAIARQLGAQGATLALLGRKAAVLSALAASFGERARCYQVDFSSDGSVEQLARRIRTDVGRLDLLVHAAGAISIAHLENASVDDLDLQYRVNVRAPYLLTQALLPLLKNSQGEIVFINSSVWLNTRSGLAQYAASKYALKAIADSVRDEVNADGVRVLSVFPGRTAGSLQKAIYTANRQPYDPERLLQPEDVAAAVLAALRLPRTAEMTDVSIRPFHKPN